jgi:alcohol dehydrogenase (cytochrome c)
VFTGTSDGYVKAFDAKNGKELWKFQTGSGVVSVPITWEMDGEQYVGIQSGYGGAVPVGRRHGRPDQAGHPGRLDVGLKLPKVAKN